MRQVIVRALSSAVPPHVVGQDEAAHWARRIFGERYAAFERMAPVFANAGIERRYAARPIEWYSQPQGLAHSNAAYLEMATALFIEATRLALDQTGMDAKDIDTIVTVSSTGIATPSLEALVHAALGLRADVARVPVFGLGCAGGVTGMALAARLASAQPGSNVLLVVVELCTLSCRVDVLSKANIVATALFGDGAAAAIFSTEGPGLAAIGGAGEHLWPDTLDIMGWDVDGDGLGVIFAQSIPGFVASQLRGAVDGWLAREGLGKDDIARFICHPGGAKVIDALESSLDLAQGTLDIERAVLAGYGNMSAPTVLFVLERVLARGLPGRAAMLALGPGFTASMLLVEPLS
ncbi:MAG: type III polyketide synthase [Sphingomonadales bacterium]|nr:type III polyketide synthase [Sphingomonadales bacterium]MDE2169775.1 type III polyketide synthase [Sphingomonadales bacterium]